MTLKEGTIRHLQDHISQKIIERGFADETLHERLLLLAEECGELIKANRKNMGMNVDAHKSHDHAIGEEVIDVINMAFAVGICLGIDIEQEFRAKEAAIDARHYERSRG